ncbi:hypothetical protein [Phocaeicola faecalis]|uniref:hypothetical protein n=1 Tax=Phocaeicola faecalis TaxID=2786956 RepID=UPI001F2D866B|nr:hypothetical protein [Phocaeicola faecalis]
MIDILEWLYAQIRFSKCEFNFICRVIRFLIRCLVNNIYPLYLRITLTPSLNESKCSNPKIIISFTSFPKRIDRVWIVVESILRQTLKPDKLILWLSLEQFPDRQIPKSLRYLISKGLDIRFVEGDIRSHKKYFYSIQEYPNDILVTIDDDIVYPSKFLKILYSYYLNDPTKVYCKYARQIVISADGQLNKYLKWNKIHFQGVDENLIFFGSGGGTLFPPHCFYKDIMNLELAISLCPIADDVFLNAMVRLNGTKISVIDLNYTFIPMSFENDERLADSNIENANDIQLNNIISYYQKKGLIIWKK